MRPIDAEEFWRKICGKTAEDWIDLMVVSESLDEMPTISEAERRGKWTQLHYKMFRCSECKKANEHYTAFCPNCGARMEGDNG